MKKETLEKKEVTSLKVLTKEKSKSLTEDFDRILKKNMSEEDYADWKDFMSFYE